MRTRATAAADCWRWTPTAQLTRLLRGGQFRLENVVEWSFDQDRCLLVVERHPLAPNGRYGTGQNGRFGRSRRRCCRSRGRRRRPVALGIGRREILSMRSFQRDIGRSSGPLNRRELSAWGADSLFRSWQWLSDVGCVIIRRRRTLREQTKINIEPPSINGFCPLSLCLQNRWRELKRH